MAKELGISIGGYSKIERDITIVSEKRLHQIAKILEVSIATIINFDAKKMLSQFDYISSQENQKVSHKNYDFEIDEEDDLDFEKMKILLDKVKSIIDRLKNTKKN